VVQPELRLVRYFVAVAEERNFTRAAARLNMAQPPLSAAVQQLETQLGVRLLERTSRQVELTSAGEVLLERGRELLAAADGTFAAVRAVERAPSGLLKVGFSPAARHGLAPRLLEAWAAAVPGVMVHTREDTTAALLREVTRRRLDLAVVFCAESSPGVATELLRAEPAVVHVWADHPLARRESVELGELKDEVLLVAGGPESPGYTAAVLRLCREAGFEPATLPDPYPDLGLQAVRERLGVAVYVATAFAGELEHTRLVPVAGGVALPFHLAWSEAARSAALDALLGAARAAASAP
jgi:DNA-binding transcriptional LysR family regulator